MEQQTSSCTHTPRPWRLDLDERISVFGPDDRLITDPSLCSHVRGWPEIQANARLIAASPDLLKACEDFVIDCKRLFAAVDAHPEDRVSVDIAMALGDLHKTMEASSPVLSKARGGEVADEKKQSSSRMTMDARCQSCGTIWQSDLQAMLSDRGLVCPECGDDRVDVRASQEESTP